MGTEVQAKFSRFFRKNNVSENISEIFLNNFFPLIKVFSNFVLVQWKY